MLGNRCERYKAKNGIGIERHRIDRVEVEAIGACAGPQANAALAFRVTLRFHAAPPAVNAAASITARLQMVIGCLRKEATALRKE